MNSLTLEELVAIHDATIKEHGGSPGILNSHILSSAVDQPRMSFGGVDLYPTISEKAAALGFSIISGHGFEDGNKRTGLLAMSMFLNRNGFFIEATNYEAEKVALAVAAGKMKRDELSEWLSRHVSPTPE